MYWAKKPDLDIHDNRKRITLVVGSYLWLVSVVWIHYAVPWGFLAAEDTVPLYVTATMTILSGCLLGHYIRRKIDA
jgi:hypothetical protein